MNNHSYKYEVTTSVLDLLGLAIENFQDIFHELSQEGFDPSLLDGSAKDLCEGFHKLHIATVYYYYGRTPRAIEVLKSSMDAGQKAITHNDQIELDI